MEIQEIVYYVILGVFALFGGYYGTGYIYGKGKKND